MGLRDFRIGGIAMFDVVVSYALAVILLIIWKFDRPYTYGLGVFVIGILVHYALGIPTQLNYKLGLSGPPKK